MPDDICTRCPHPYGPHAVIATTGEPSEGGIILCPEPGCRCYATWGVNGAKPVFVPNEEQLATFRSLAQGGIAES